MSAVSRATPTTAGRHLGVRLDPELRGSLKLVTGQIDCRLSVSRVWRPAGRPVMPRWPGCPASGWSWPEPP